jgi:MFS family permease
VFGDLADGVRYCAGQPRLRLMVLFFIFVMMIGFPYVTVLPGLVENQFGRPASSVGIISSVVAGGGFAASLVAAPFVGSSRARILYTMLGFGFGLSLILMALAPVYALIYVPALLVGLTSGGFQTLNGAVIVSETDPAYFGRVLSLQMLAFAGFGLMALPLGILADAFGERITLGGMGAAVCAVVVLFGTLIARASRTPIVQMPVPAPSGGLAEDRVR